LEDLDKIKEMLYEDWRDAILMMCDKLPDRTCPFCEEVYEDDAEYVDVGVGQVQVTGNHCENPNCGAWELGAYTCPDDHDYCGGWVRPKFSCPDDWKLAGHEWWCAAAGKRNEMKWGKKSEKCICHSESEKAKAQASGLLTRENYDKAIGRSTYKYNPSDPNLLDFIEELGLNKQEIADAFKTSLTAAEKEIWEKQ
jgi:hypothetical protein